MQFSEAWLRTFVDPARDSEALCHLLTMAGLEVEDAHRAGPALEQVVVARVIEVRPHPDADRLRVCLVDTGAAGERTIVCGAPNVAAGQCVPCALPGARLPGGVDIRAAVVRGVESAGMLCSAAELGVSDDAAGLLVLDANLPAGTPISEALALNDTLITLKLTPNRGDCLSILGIGREVSALTGQPLAVPAVDPVLATGAHPRAVSVHEPAACPRFAARVIRGIDPKAPTPAWMRQRIERSGIRSISAVVDVTNYVMLEMGQPLHAYDERELEGDIVVRFPHPGEKLTLLNEQTIDLDADMLLVCDQRKPLGLAGIMGGEHSAIGDTTRDVFLEGAFWSPEVIQGRSRRLGFSSDAGHRFERGVDFGNTVRAVERATRLIVDICGGQASALIDEIAELPDRPPVTVRASRVCSLLGVEVPATTIEDIFTRLGCRVERLADGWSVHPPTYRFDLAIEEDCIEEIARVHGYERITSRSVRHAQQMLRAPEARLTAWDLRDRLVGRDYQEVVTFSFVSSDWERDLAANDNAVRVLNPIASHLDVMRSTLAGSLIDVLRTNVARRQSRARIFEVGRCFLRDGDEVGFQQPLRVGGLAFGDVTEAQWATAARGVDFFDVKGDVAALAAPRRITTLAARHPALHPGRSARVLLEGNDIGWLGELHPRVVRSYELPSAPVMFELALSPLLQVEVPRARPVSRLPAVRRDLAVVVDDAIPAQTLLAALVAGKPAAVESLSLFDVYRGTGVPPGKKSLAILVLMQDTQRTLTDAEIEENVSQLVRLLEEKFGASLR